MKIRSEQGASAVEFALVLPVLLLLTFGIIEFSILLYDKAVITNASREGARAGIVYAINSDKVYAPMSNPDIKTVIKRYANGLLINLGATKNTLADDDIVVTPEPHATGSDLMVTVTYTYNFLIFPNLTKLVGGDGTFTGAIELVGKTVMRME